MAFLSFYILIVVCFLVLAILYLIEFGKGVRKNFSDSKQNWTIGIMTIALTLVFLNPNGLINFDKLLEGNDLFVARREGAANCMTTFKLKPNNKFKEQTVCFGISEVRGSYEIKNDTIFFSEVNASRGTEEYYEFGVLKKSKYSDKIALFRYLNRNDTIGHELWITKNEILK